VAAACAAAVALGWSAGSFAVAAAAAGSPSVLGQAQGSSGTPSPSSGSSGGSPIAGSGGSASSLDPKADFGAPGVDAGRRLIAWAKAGAMVLGTLGMIGGSIVGKLLRQAGNHHAEGVRATAMGISGALVLAGSAATIVSWLMTA
jgi:hypothetical protein